MNKGQDVILITGATGQQGGATARALLADGHKVVAMTRNPSSEKARALTSLGAEVIPGDLDDEASLRSALEGKWGVFAVQNTWEAGVEGEEEQGKRLALLAKEAGVEHYVYASVGSADQDTGIPHFDNKYGSMIANIVPCGPIVFRKACYYNVIRRIRAVFTGSLLCRYVPYCTIVYPSICDTQVGYTACVNDPLRPPSWHE